jgi:hypothetical protein
VAVFVFTHIKGGQVPTDIQSMTDAEIVAGVRNGLYAIVPLEEDKYKTVGPITLDDFEAVEGCHCLLIELSKDDSRFVAQQMDF